MAVRGVIFDLGGVVFESPMAAIAAFELERGMPSGVVNRTVVDEGPGGAWARHERGEIGRAEFLDEFRREFRERGFDVDTGALMARVETTFAPRPRMIRAIAALRRASLRVAALTNNWEAFGDAPIVSHFDVFVESAVEGVRKPEPEIYRIVLDRLDVPPDHVVMLDDLGPNLKTARGMGMHTIKVVDPDAALDELSAMTGVGL